MTLRRLDRPRAGGYKLFSLDAVYEYRSGDDEEKK